MHVACYLVRNKERSGIFLWAHEFQPTGQNSWQASSTKAPLSARMNPRGCASTCMAIALQISLVNFQEQHHCQWLLVACRPASGAQMALQRVSWYM